MLGKKSPIALVTIISEVFVRSDLNSCEFIPLPTISKRGWALQRAYDKTTDILKEVKERELEEDRQKHYLKHRKDKNE